MKYLKTKEELLFYSDKPRKKSPINYKFNLGDYVVCNKIPNNWKNEGYDENTICVVCVVHTKNNNGEYSGFPTFPKKPYVIVPIDANSSDFEEWVNEEDIKFAPDEIIAAYKYNL